MDAATVLERRLLPRPPIAAFAAPAATVPLGSSAGDICAGGIRTAGAGRGGRTGPRSSRAPTLSVIDLWGVGGSPAKRQRPGRRQREDRPLCSSRLRGGSERASVRPFRRVLTAAKRRHAPDWRDSAANTIGEGGAKQEMLIIFGKSAVRGTGAPLPPVACGIRHPLEREEYLEPLVRLIFANISKEEVDMPRTDGERPFHR